MKKERKRKERPIFKKKNKQTETEKGENKWK